MHGHSVDKIHPSHHTRCLAEWFRPVSNYQRMESVIPDAQEHNLGEGMFHLHGHVDGLLTIFPRIDSILLPSEACLGCESENDGFVSIERIWDVGWWCIYPTW